MRRFSPLVPRRSAAVRLILGAVLAVVLAMSTIQAQIPGRNVNMVSGVRMPEGDPFLQRQNEPSIAASTRNPLHLLGGSNDYRTVDLPGLPNDEETGDAWLGLYKSSDGGQRWTSGLLPGYPQERADEGLDVQGQKSPLKTGAYQAAADAVVRAGTNGLFYYSGLAFNRGENGKSAIFLSRFIDNNNREDRDATIYLGTSLIATSTGTDGRFLDKPWMAVDIPRGGNPGTCRIETPGERHVSSQGVVTQEPPVVQRIPAGTVYVGYTVFTGPAADRRADVFLTRSFDCGVTWQAPMQVSRPEDPLNQGAAISVDPRNGHIYVAWRRFSKAGSATTTASLDGVMLAKLPSGGRKFNPPGTARRFPKGQKKGLQPERFGKAHEGTEVEEPNEFDQSSSGYQFRTNAYPTMTVDGDGRVYLAWSERGFAKFRTSPLDGDARIVMVTTTDGTTFTAPQAVDNDPSVTGAVTSNVLVGHQVMPSLTFAGGKLMLIYYDLRETKAAKKLGDTVFGPRITDQGLSVRNTIDIRASMGAPGDIPRFAPSVKVSEYKMGFRNGSSEREQLQYNPPNLPMFKQGTWPFMGDYIDVASGAAFVPTGKGKWAFNTAAGPSLPIFHAVWTDNRDVRAPANGDWTRYAPPTNTQYSAQQCIAGNAGSRNQNIYTSRITGGLLVGSPGNAKPLSPTVQRGFVVFAQNATLQTRTFRMTIVSQPPGGRASFDQFPQPPFTASSPAPRTVIDLAVPPRSTSARTVYATSTDPRAQIDVTVAEIGAVGGTVVSGGLQDRVVLNPDIENPDIENPDIENAEVYNPDIENPDIENPDIENPDIENPDIENPDIENPDIENPDIENITVANPDIENPDIENPDIENPDIENPDIENPDIENVAVGGDGVLTDITWNVTNTGNTTSAFNVNLFLAQSNLPAGLKTQLILHKSYRTPVVKPNDCSLAYETRNVVVANIPRPEFVRPSDGGVPDQNDPSAKNATLWLGPGEIGKITLRVYDADRSNNVPVTDKNGKVSYVDPALNPTTAVTPAVSSQAVDTTQTATRTEPPLVTPTGANLFFLQSPTNALVGAAVVPAVSVQVRDNLSGLLVPGAPVTLSLATNPTGAILLGGNAVSDAAGIATFPSLSVSLPGTGYTLMASATTAGVTATALSAPFDVLPVGPPPGVVVNTNDSGPGSLRAAIEYANATPGVQTITFDIDGAGPGSPAVITPATPLPALAEAVVIDGTSQSGWDGKPVVEVRSPSTNLAWTGFDLEASGITIRGLAITQFGQGVFAFQGFTGHVLEQNYIGTNRLDEARGNGFGVMWRASSSAIRNNVISGNDADGLSLIIGASSNVVSNNRIGLRADGLAALPNGHNGVTLYDGANNNTFDGNVVSGNTGLGVDIQKNDNVAVAGTRFINNTIGLDEGGQAMANRGGGIRLDSAPDTVIGEPGAGNTISGNQVPPVAEVGGYTGGPGITVLGSTGVEDLPVIQANRIGTDPTGNEARPNKFEGIFLYGPARVGGSSLEGRGNRIAGNGVAGIGAGTGVAIIDSGAAGSVVQGNIIGLASGGASLGNGYSGITVYGGVQNVLIGGDDPGEANTIAGNEAAGIAVYTVDGPSPQEITIAGNAIYGNVGAGISLAPGANNSQPYPVVRNARNTGSDTLVDFDLAGFAASNYTLRFFASATCDAGGRGEGEAWVGKTTVDSGVSATGSILLPLQSAGRVITATATDSDGNTSEFSACAVIASPLATLSALLPGSPSRDQMVTFQGTGLTPFLGVPRPKAFFTQGATVSEGFVFFSEAGKWWVRLPGGLAAGPATVYAADSTGVPLTAPFAFTVSATPAAPIITAIVPLNSATAAAGGAPCGGGYASLAPTGTATPGQGLGVVAYGTDTMGATVVFTQGANVFEVAADCSTSPTLGLGVTVTVPAGLAPGPVSVSVKQQVGFATSAQSAAVVMNVPAGTVTAAIGGTGGSPFGPYSCAAGTTAVGFRVHTGQSYALTAAELMCSNGISTPSFGGTTVPDTALSCAVGDRMVGMVGSVTAGGIGGVVGGIAPRCQSVTGAIAPSFGGLPIGGSLTFDCPAGTVVLGVQGRQGAVLDQLALICGPPPNF